MWGRAALLGLLAVSCAPAVGNAPFTARPDTLRPGDLRGPFDGIVVDGETERPVAGAIVFGSWAFERGEGLVGPAGAVDAYVETSADGRYRLNIPADLPGDGARLRRFTLVVYQRGYAGWRSDHLFPSGEPRHDFAQRGNRVRMTRWQPSYSRYQHLVFLGGGTAIRTAAAWEVQLASLELEGRAPVAAAPSAGAKPAVAAPLLLDIAPLLSEAEIRGVTGYAGAFSVAKLPGRPTSDVYDSLHFKAEDKPETYDVGLRVWALGTDAAEAQFRQLLGELPGAVATEELGDASLRAKGGGVLGFAFLLRERGVVMQLSCGVAQCTEPSMILRMAKLADSHLPEVRLPEPAASGLAPVTVPPEPAVKP